MEGTPHHRFNYHRVSRRVSSGRRLPLFASPPPQFTSTCLLRSRTDPSRVYNLNPIEPLEPTFNVLNERREMRIGANRFHSSSLLVCYIPVSFFVFLFLHRSIRQGLYRGLNLNGGGKENCENRGREIRDNWNDRDG